MESNTELALSLNKANKNIEAIRDLHANADGVLKEVLINKLEELLKEIKDDTTY